MADRHHAPAGTALVVTALAMLSLAACTTAETGTPVVERMSGNSANDSRSSAAAAPTTGSRTSPPPNPPRPRDLPIAGIDPCSLLTKEQQQRFGVDEPLRPRQEPTFKSPLCGFASRQNKIVFDVITVTTSGIDRFKPGKVNGEVRPLTVHAFPGFEVFTELLPTSYVFCVVVVDVADGQVAHVTYREDGARLGKAEVCRRTAQVADAVVGNLLAR
ncbi:DUF3558 domain-containing protein [Kibdelosporangium phytohabitans]|uniref:DUF3558 domain-containing protein n=1 Tax=Kibdelosporangium phytohabitans TaxID=860235 RepID=UPI0014700EDA|nr:DUF3558 domain-containing protein [Kibdelosporangium phytohabitans]MBE1469524.1 hypothetical protein [Kibdelosporangium phytohabitans]